MVENIMSNFIQLIFILLKTIALTIFGPVISAIDSLLQYLQLDTYIILLNSLFEDYIAPCVGFFFEFMGPLTVNVILLEIATTIGFYAIMMMTTFTLKLFNIIKKLPLA